MVTKMNERINWFRKDYVHDHYSRIVPRFKNYENISKKKMLEAIYKVYSNYKNIIDICTVRELKYLKKLFDKQTKMEDLLSEKYEWERKALANKFLIANDIDNVFVPDEIIDIVKLALKNVKWDVAKKLDTVNEILVSYCKIQGSAILFSVANFGSLLTGINEDDLITHMYYNKVFNYYVYIYDKDFDSLGKDIPIAVYQDYYHIEDRLEEERQKQGLAATLPIDIDTLKTYFYNDFDINNKKIKKFLNEVKKLPLFWTNALNEVRYFATLNIDRNPLKEEISNVPNLKNYDLKNFFKIMDEAMDEMPSGALNGLTPKQAIELKAESELIKYEKTKKYEKQENACLSKEDAKTFYKIYFALLEFTNNKYKIKKGLKIYNRVRLNPQELQDIIECFWNNKEKVVLEFCQNNPYNFNKEELSIASDFKKGFRSIVIIARFEKEYTGVICIDKVYMIKGINDNLDNIISYKDLPVPTITSIIPFKNNLVYDGIILNFAIDLGNNFIKIVDEEYNKSIKYYHL